MKKTILILVTVTTALLTQAAFADRGYARGYNNRHYDYGYRGHRADFRRGYNRHFYNSRYTRNRYRPGNRVNINVRNAYYGNRGYYRSRDSFNTGSFLGGLVLGSVLTYPRYNYVPRNTYYYRAPTVRYSTYNPPVTVIKRSTTLAPPPTVTPGRKLLRDLQGRCYEILQDENGDVLRIELEAEACNF